MDFTYTDEEQAVAELTARILGDHATQDRLRELERSDGDRFDPQLWAALADAGLLGATLPETVGGAGQGLMALGSLLEPLGRTVAPVPLLETLAYGAAPIARLGTPEQQQRWLAPVVAGDMVLTGAYQEEGAEPTSPTTVARRAGDGWELTGSKLCVPAAQLAGAMVCPASTADGQAALFVVDLAASGSRVTPVDVTDGWPEASVTLDGTPAELLGSLARGGDALAWALDVATAAQCTVLTGVCAAALQYTADYTKERKQFDVPIASFQAVAHRAADAYVDTEGVRLTALQAMWRLAEDLPARAEVGVAKIWAAEAGQRVLAAAMHLHGGVGVDRDYPVHRYYLAAKHLELQFGGASRHLVALGRIIADEPV